LALKKLRQLDSMNACTIKEKALF